MDPNETLKQLLGWAEWSLARHPGTTQADGAQMILDMHDWLSKGGHLPDEWMPRGTSATRKLL